MKFLSEPSLQGKNVGSPQFFFAQAELIHKRPLLKYCYDIWYRLLLDDRAVQSAPANSIFLELGSGGSLLKEYEPRVLTSDVTPNIAERVIDARVLPFPDGSVSAIFMTHVFHHIPDVTAFLSEADRVLRPGGIVAIIDVAATPFARFFFSNFHHEPFLPKMGDWKFSQTDSMMDSNQALTWMVFKRDIELYREKFPTLRLEKISYLPWLPYLLSGGVTKRNIVPGFAIAPIIAMDRFSKFLLPMCSLHWFIRLRKA